LTKGYPWYTPYQFAGNKPIFAVDLDGLEELWGMGMIQGKENRPCQTLTDQLDVLTALSNNTFKLGFDHYIPQKLIDHYSYGKGAEYKLSKKEMVDINPQKMGIQGLIQKDKDQFQEVLKTMNVCEQKETTFNVLGGSLLSGGLGVFTMKFHGTITKLEGGEWKFVGKMQFIDKWNFDSHNEDVKKGETEYRSPAGDVVTTFARKYLRGTGFNIVSEEVDVEQTSDDLYVDWFDDKTPKSIPNRVYKNEDLMKKMKADTQ
jgi:hypothetical protein